MHHYNLILNEKANLFKETFCDPKCLPYVSPISMYAYFIVDLQLHNGLIECRIYFTGIQNNPFGLYKPEKRKAHRPRDTLPQTIPVRDWTTR